MPNVTEKPSLFATPVMTAENEPGMELKMTPVRISGFVALAIGVISFFAILGLPLVVIPLAAVLVALIALRPYADERPVGIVPAWVGLFLAVMFGVWGVTTHQLKNRSMSAQATRFALEWLQLISQGDVELAHELQLHPLRRQPETMPLAEYYSRTDAAAEQLEKFRELTVVSRLIRLGSEPRWVLARTPAVFTKWGREKTQTVWRDTSGAHSTWLLVELEYLPPEDGRKAQWKVELVSDYFEGDPKSV